MLERKLSFTLAIAALVLAGRVTAQSAIPSAKADEHEAALEQANGAREFAAEEAAAERELAGQTGAAQRDYDTVQRDAREVRREYALTAAERANMERQLSRTREELARTVAEVARIQAQVREPRLQEIQRNWRYVAAGQPVLGLNIEDSDFGVFVRGVTPNGPSATAGVEVGDTIVSINDVELARGGDGRSPSATLLGQIGNVVPGDDVKLRILRGGDYRDFVVKAGENEFRKPLVNVFTAPGFSKGSWTGFQYAGVWNDIELVSLTPALGEYFGTEEGLLVVHAGQAAELGFRDGDVIIDLAGRKPQSPEHALRILASFEPSESLQAAIMRQKRRESLAIRVPTPSE
jgi:type II secretory pathway component PulC